MKKINLGISGCANVAKKYAIDAFKKIEGIDKVYIASRDTNKAKEWAKNFGIEFKDSYESILEDQSINAIYIPLPISMHEEWAIKCAEKGKHVICEKTLAGHLDCTKRIVNAFKERNLTLFENFVCDYHPQHNKIISLINKGEIGKPMIFKSFFGFMVPEGNIRRDKNLDTGCFNDIGGYMVFMSRKIFREEPVSVIADFNHEEGSLYMKFPNNKTAFGAFGFNHAYQNNYSVWGSKGVIGTDRAYSIPVGTKVMVNLFKTNMTGDTNEKIEIENSNQFELIFRDFCSTIINQDNEKRTKKYEDIMSQARVIQLLRDANDNGTKISNDNLI